MPDTPIDLSEGIQSVRLKVPTAEVPIPPAGFAQLHSPTPGELALRLPDGSVAPIGSGGGGGGDTIAGDGGSVSTDATPGHDPGVVLSPVLGKTIWLNGPVVGPGENDPQAPQALTLLQRGSPPAQPTGALTVLWIDANGALHAANNNDADALLLAVGGATQVSLTDGRVTLSAGGPDLLVAQDTSISLRSGLGGITVQDGAVFLSTTIATMLVTGLPTADPHVDGALWIAPITRQLMVSAG